MESPPSSAATITTEASSSSLPPPVPASSSETLALTDDNDVDGDVPPSKSQMKKRRRYEKLLAIKLRRKEQTREVKRLKAERDGRDLDAERRIQMINEANGSGRARRDARWNAILSKANVDNSFRVCFDCSFESQMTPKECNSLALQLRYAYATNRRSSAPVRVDVYGLKIGDVTRGHLMNVEGFPGRWEERAFRCHEGDLEEVYTSCRGSDGSTNGDDRSDENGGVSRGSSCDAIQGDIETGNVDVATDSGGGSCVAPPGPRLCAFDTAFDIVGDGRANEVIAVDGDGRKALGCAATSPTTMRRPPPSSPTPPGHRFVYLTGDSPNTLKTLSNNSTYIIGGIVDRNRLKFAAMKRAESINKVAPHLNVCTARLPLDEHVDLKGSTRVLTCNHVFEILQRYRENGADWRDAIMTVLPCRKDAEEKRTDDDIEKKGGDNGKNEDDGVHIDALN
ncbi:hypothetical protein ACHAXA_009060 [Cyclostephanos tholiformis]|uniref:tRNA (guanine(9)-N(1))-methyltransferase n=1 Tax=Cyclostephanos tholiformis TaxID=382380 RepID=A0ABD3R8J7_9STRA